MWLYPASYLLHIIEELWGGDGFVAWFSKAFSRGLTDRSFLTLNCLALALLTAGIILILKGAPLRWLLPSFATAVLTNGLSHLLASLWTASYSPGTYTGLLLWVPLGAGTLWHMWARMKAGKFWTGVTLGLSIHAVVLLVLFL